MAVTTVELGTPREGGKGVTHTERLESGWYLSIGWFWPRGQPLEYTVYLHNRRYIIDSWPMFDHLFDNADSAVRFYNLACDHDKECSEFNRSQYAQQNAGETPWR